MGSTDKGWIKLHRKITKSEIWLSEDPFDKRSAWVDLLVMSSYEGGSVTIEGKKRNRLRGQVITSISALSRRWGWSRKKVRSFLEQMGNRHMTRLEGHTRYCVITIENWDVYQSMNRKKGQTSGTDLGTPRSIDKEDKDSNGMEQPATAPAEEDDDGMTMEEYLEIWGSTDLTEQMQSDSSESRT